MKIINRLLWGFFLAAIILVGCSDSEELIDLDLPDVEPRPEIDQEAVEEAGRKFEGEWTFEMVAVAAFDFVKNYLESDWYGEFTVGSDGKIAGEGTGTYKGEIFVVEDDGCGHKWSVEGTFDFSIEGMANQDGKTLQVSILAPILTDLSEGAVIKICEDQPPWRHPSGYSNLFVDNFLEAISESGRNLGMHLEPNEPVTGKGFATVTLVIAWKIPLEPLAPSD